MVYYMYLFSHLLSSESKSPISRTKRQFLFKIKFKFESNRKFKNFYLINTVCFTFLSLINMANIKIAIIRSDATLQ